GNARHSRPATSSAANPARYRRWPPAAGARASAARPAAARPAAPRTAPAAGWPRRRRRETGRDRRTAPARADTREEGRSPAPAAGARIMTNSPRRGNPAPSLGLAALAQAGQHALGVLRAVHARRLVLDLGDGRQQLRAVLCQARL